MVLIHQLAIETCRLTNPGHTASLPTNTRDTAPQVLAQLLRVNIAFDDIGWLL